MFHLHGDAAAGVPADAVEVGWCKLNPVEARVDSDWLQRLISICDKHVSRFAFNFNSRPYMEAARLFTEAADREFPEALHRLGMLHKEGLGVEQNHVKAVKFFTRAATLGHVASIYQFGVCKARRCSLNRQTHVQTAGTKCLKLEYEEPPSNFAFNFHLRRYRKANGEGTKKEVAWGVQCFAEASVGTDG